MLDHYGRTIDHLRLSVTDRCGLRCLYCMPDGNRRTASRAEILSFEEIALVVRHLYDRFGLRRVRITGGEPLVRPHLERLIAMLGTIGLEEIAMTTNGQILARSIPSLAAAGLKRVNVSLDSLDADRYRELTGGDLARTLAGIEAVDRWGLKPLKINTVIVRGRNENEVERLTRWALERGYEIRFLELMAIGCVRVDHGSMFVSSAELRERLSQSFRLELIEGEPGAPARLWRLEGGGLAGRVGFISPESEPFCTACRRLRLTARGRLLGCLMHEDGPDLRATLRRAEGIDRRAFEEAVVAAVGAKPTERIPAGMGTMAEIGG